jgi:hypothetical protein
VHRKLLSCHSKDDVCTSKTFTNKTHARTWTQRIEVAIETGAYQAEQVQLPTLGKLLDRYETEVTAQKKSNKAERSRLRTLHADELAKQPLERITAPDIAALRDRACQNPFQWHGAADDRPHQPCIHGDPQGMGYSGGQPGDGHTQTTARSGQGPPPLPR